MNRKRIRSVAARPPSRLLTGTSLGSEPVVLTAPAWGTRRLLGRGAHPASADLETERHQIPIRGLPQPTGCKCTRSSRRRCSDRQASNKRKNRTVFCYRPYCQPPESTPDPFASFDSAEG